MLEYRHYFALEQMSVRARLALSATCLERVLNAWGGHSPAAQRLVSALWSHTDADDLSVWDEHIRDLVAGIDDHQGLSVNASLEPARVTALHDLILDVWEAGGGNLYGAYRSEYTRKPALRVLAFMYRHSIPIPDLQPFLRSSASECGGLGAPRPRAFFSGA